MLWIVLSNGDQIACNRYREGFFIRGKDGSWRQWKGTGQTPRFKTWKHLRKWAGKNYSGFENARTVEIGPGWND
jgi:hypothetical protein